MCDMVKLDCFAYDKDKIECKYLKRLYCENKNCNFYKTREQIREEQVKCR